MEDEGELEIPFAWVGADELPIVYVNQMFIQHLPGEFLIVLGQMAPPAITGTKDQVAAQLADLEYVPVKPLIRFATTPNRLREIAAAMDAAITKYDKMMDDMDPTK